MTPDNELPIWPFQPNWREPIVERLTWLSTVLVSDTGAEQAYGSRLSPRREFEAMFNPMNDARTFFDLFLSELGGQEMMVPLWHDRHKLTSAIEDGDNRIDCDTEFGEFMDGGMALLIGADPWSNQAVEIDEVDGTGFALAVAADFDWPNGGVILPLRRSRIDLQPGLQNLTNTVGQSTMRFVLNQANDLPDTGAWGGLTLDAIPVITQSSNWAEPVEMNFARISETEDNDTGIAFVRDIAERAFRSINHSWQLRGKEDNWTFRQFLYRMGGRRSPVYMPTGAADMVVAATADIGANNVQVRRVGLTYIGGPAPGRDKFLAITKDGVAQARTITGLGAPAQPTYERINLNTVLTTALPAGTTLSFLEVMRADGDSIELLHHTDTEGMTECSINFRGFSNTRDPSGSNFVPLPNEAQGELGCGTPNPEDVNPCAPAFFDGVYLRFFFNWNLPLNGSTNLPSANIDDEDGQIGGLQPNGTGGKVIPGNWSNQSAIYENNVEGNPLLNGQLLYRRYNDLGTPRTYVWEFYFPIDITGDWTALTQWNAGTISNNTPARFSMQEWNEGPGVTVELQEQMVGPLFPDYWAWTL